MISDEWTRSLFEQLEAIARNPKVSRAEVQTAIGMLPDLDVDERASLADFYEDARARAWLRDAPKDAAKEIEHG